VITLRQIQHLAAAMAHEVRNPLNSMAIHVELLEGRLKKKEAAALPDREAAMRSVTVIGGEIERVDHILEEFLQLAGPEEAARKPVEPAALIDAAAQRVRPEAERRGVRIEVKMVGALQPWPVDAIAVGDVIDALLSNAVEASPSGTVVAIEARNGEDEAEVVVRDHGEGITAEELPKVFHIGFSRRGRAGIGLAVAKQIAKGHGGSLTCESGGAGQGATFFLRVPLEPDA
jgi:signal transduction histidine kinase